MFLQRSGTLDKAEKTVSKKNELAKPDNGQTTALAERNATAGMGWSMEGEDRSDFLIPRVIVHQGDIAEKFYGVHEKGALIDTSTKEELPSKRFVPLTAWKEYIRWGENLGDPPVYVTRNRADVPDADLQWNGDEPPACTTFRNFAVLFDGMQMPMVLSLSDAKKPQRNAGKLLNQLEKQRAATGKGRGLYEVQIVDCENKKGKWKDMNVQPVGNPSEELADAAATWIATISGAELRTNVVESEPTASQPDDFNPDA